MTYHMRSFHPSNGGRAAREAADSGLLPFFELTADPLLVLDASHVILAANPAAARLMATTPERLKGSSVLEIDLLARVLTASSVLQKVKTDPPPIVDEVSITDAEDQPIQCRIEAVQIPGNRTLLHLQDTTAVLRSRAALHAADQIHRAIFEGLPEVAWAMALPEERLIDVSPAVEGLFGHQPATLLQHPELWDELVHPADRERVRAEFRRGLATRRPFEISFTGLHRDHRDLPDLVNRVVPVLDDNGWIGRCQGFIEDRGLTRRLEEDLHFGQAYLRHVLDSVSSGVMIVQRGEDGPIVRLSNRRFADMLHLDEPIKPGTPLADLPPEVRKLALGSDRESQFERRLESEDVREEVAEFDQPQRMLRRFAGPVLDGYGAVIGRIITVEDVTSSWLLQVRLTHAQKMESMGRLAGGVAHDFNNLLGTILGFGSLLLEQTPVGDSRREPLLEIVGAAERASRVTSALLTFSRSARFERLPLSLNKVIEDSYQLLRSTLDSSIALELKLEHDLPPMLGDALLIQQVVLNLVHEARDRIAPGGSVRLTTRSENTPPDADKGGAKAPRMVAFEVEISASRPAQASPALAPPISAPPDRSGLALSMTEDIVRAHGGYLVSDSEARPALFRVVFPVEAPDMPALFAPDHATAHGHETVLVVDDEPGLRVLAKTGLQQRGFDVLTAENGEKALEVLRSGEPGVDVVLLDLSMPGLSGERVLRAIRGFKPELPVIIASGYATVESQSAWADAGAQGFVGKPYRIQDVATKLREVLDRRTGRVL